MKRLKNMLLAMDENTSTYGAMYEGILYVMQDGWYESEIANDNRYFQEGIGYTITLSHKLAQDVPTVTVEIPMERLGIRAASLGAADHCLRAFAPYIDALNAALYNRSRPDKENGKYYLHRPGGEILLRNTAYFALCPQKDYENRGGLNVYGLTDGVERPPRLCLCIRMQVQLPRKKIRRTIQMLTKDLPGAVEAFAAEFDAVRLSEVVELAEKQAAIRAWLKKSDYCAFLANGSILPREKGGDGPMEGAIPFTSTPEDEIEIAGIRGMGIRRGVTVITGGGYSGKSTVLDAISAGIYDHCLGDGRELCLTEDTAMTISAEDGRGVKSVNISPFIKWLPGGDTRDFSTDHASGSTSQAANIMEAVDSGAKLLLIDEDRSATNFMIRDRMMKQLIEREPITPFTDRVRELHAACGVSTILVIGGSGEYLSVADRIYRMDEYRISDVTEMAREICAAYGVTAECPLPAQWRQARRLYGEGFTSYPTEGHTERLAVSDMGFIQIGDEQIDIRGLHDIVSPRQTDALAYMLRLLAVRNTETVIDLDAKLDILYEEIDREGLDVVFSSFFTTTGRFLDLPRRCEIKAVVNRMRRIRYTARI